MGLYMPSEYIIGGMFATLTAVIITVAIHLQCRKRRLRNEVQLAEKETELIDKTLSLEKLKEENSWLLKEVHHRVKNNLQIILSLLNSQSAFLKDTAAINAISNSRQRVAALSMIHQRLYNDSEHLSRVQMEGYIIALIESLKDSFSIKNQIRFSFGIGAIELEATQAVPLGLILNEAITNAIRHAFPSGNGQISIRMSTADNILLLEIQDDGIGIPAEPALTGKERLGLKLIKGLTNELNGSLIFEKVTQGTLLRITVELSEPIT